MKNKLYVGNLSYDTNESGLRDHFAQYGDIQDLKIIMDHATGRSKGFAFITFDSTGSAEAALEANGKSLDNRELRVNIARDNKSRDGA